MYIEQEYDIENIDERNAEAVEEADEIVTLVLLPETQENWQEKLKTQSPIKNLSHLRDQKTGDKSRFGVKMGCDNSEYGLYV